MEAVFDTSTYNAVARDEELLNLVREAVEEGDLTIYQTHVERDQIEATEDDELRERMLSVPTEEIATSHFIAGFSRVGKARVSSNEKYDEAKGNAEAAGEVEDAIIAATAECDADLFVTDDERQRKRAEDITDELDIRSTDELRNLLQ